MNSRVNSHHIFITHTIFQNEIVNLILNQYFHGKNHFTTLLTSVSGFDRNAFSKVIEYNSNSVTGIFQLMDIKNYLDRYLQTSQIFVPNIDGLVDNYCYIKSLESGLQNINFYFDGILFLYQYKHNVASRHRIRNIIASAFGMKYTFQESIFPYAAINVNNIYSVLPDYTLGSDTQNILPIRLEKKPYDVKSRNRIVLLTADITPYKHVFFNKLLDNILDSCPEAEIYFKHHPKETELKSYQAMVKSKGLKYNSIPQSEIIENLIEDIGPAKVIGYPSTALMTLKIIYGKKLNVECVFSREMPETMRSLTKAYNALEINSYVL